MNFLHNFSPQPILIDFGFITIRWYGFFMVLALILGLWLAIYLAKKRGLKADDVFDLGFWLALFGLLGARLYEVFVLDWSYYQNNLSAIFKIWEGGLAIHGAILGGGLALIVWAKKKKISFWLLADIIAPALALGQAIGRWGNYFNQELFGRPTDLPWGIFISPANRPVESLNFYYFHPAFLYESILDFILFLVLIFLAKSKRPFPLSFIRGGLGRGSIALIYILGYALIRFLMEFIRIDPTPEFWGLRLPQWVSILLIIGAVALLKLKIKSAKIK